MIKNTKRNMKRLPESLYSKAHFKLMIMDIMILNFRKARMRFNEAKGNPEDGLKVDRRGKWHPNMEAGCQHLKIIRRIPSNSTSKVCVKRIRSRDMKRYLDTHI